MPFATTWMDLEIGNLSEINQKKTNITWHHLYTETNKQKKDSNELIFKTETDSQT